MKTKQSIKAIDKLIKQHKGEQDIYERLMAIRHKLKKLSVILLLLISSTAFSQGNKVVLVVPTGVAGTDTTSISNRINSKLAIGDTAAMLLPYLRKADTLQYATALSQRMRYADTAGMLSPYLRKADTLQYSTALLQRVLYTDTAAMLAPYLTTSTAAATYATIASLGVKVNATDTAAMLLPYLRKADTLQYNTALNQRLRISDTAAMLSPYVRSSQVDAYINNLAKWEYWNDWIAAPTATTSGGNDLVVNATGTGAGAGMVATPSANRPGVVTLQTGSTATGRTSFYTNSGLNTIELGGGAATLATDLFVPTLSTSGERFAFLFGFYDATTMNQTDGIYFLYDEGGVSTGSTASANWQCVTVRNSTRTFTTTSTAVSNTDFQRLSIEVNAAGTSVDFKIGGTTVATHTTNIPTGNTRLVSYGYQLIKSIGTGARTVRTDWTYAKINFTTSR